MAFDKEGFKEWINDEFNFNWQTKRIIYNLVDYGVENLDNTKNQLVNFIQEILDEPTFEEIKRFEMEETNTNKQEIYKNMEVKNMKNKNEKMNYKDIRNLVEKLGNENYQDLIKALVSFEKGVNDMNALDKIYNEFMDSDIKGLLHEDFDYMIDELRENGEIDESITFALDKDDFTSVVGNIVGDVDVIDKQIKNGEVLKIVNFTVGNHDEQGNNVYINCSAYGEKTELSKDFKQGDFVKISGILKYSTDDKGKEYTNLRVEKSTMLKAKEQMKDNQKEEKQSILGALKDFKENQKNEKIDKKEPTKASSKDMEI